MFMFTYDSMYLSLYVSIHFYMCTGTLRFAHFTILYTYIQTIFYYILQYIHVIVNVNIVIVNIVNVNIVSVILNINIVIVNIYIFKNLLPQKDTLD